MIFFIRSSNSPRYFVPATKAPMSSIIKRLFCMSSGLPHWWFFGLSLRRSRFSQHQVPPREQGCFWVRRLRIWINRLTSLARPTTGSRRFSRANLVKSRAKESKVGVPCCALTWAGRRRPALRWFCFHWKPIFFFKSWRIFARLKPISAWFVKPICLRLLISPIIDVRYRFVVPLNAWLHPLHKQMYVLLVVNMRDRHFLDIDERCRTLLNVRFLHEYHFLWYSFPARFCRRSRFVQWPMPIECVQNLLLGA